MNDVARVMYICEGTSIVRGDDWGGRNKNIRLPPEYMINTPALAELTHHCCEKLDCRISALNFHVHALPLLDHSLTTSLTLYYYHHPLNLKTVVLASYSMLTLVLQLNMNATMHA